GTVSLNADGSFVYTPDPDFVGVDTFTYVLDTDSTAEITATIKVNALATPQAKDDQYSVDAGQSLTVVAPGVLENDTGLTSVTLKKQTTYGIVSLQTDGSFTYMPQPGFWGTDLFDYEGTAGITATVAITVNPTQSASRVDSSFTGAVQELNRLVPDTMGS